MTVKRSFVPWFRGQKARKKPLPSSKQQLRGTKKKIPGFWIFSLLNCESKTNKFSGILIFFVTVACRRGLCVPNMIITKANAKDNGGGIYLPFPLRKLNAHSSTPTPVFLTVREETQTMVQAKLRPKLRPPETLYLPGKGKTRNMV